MPLDSALGCPWSSFSPASLRFCEERLCSWVVEPANTWSNIGYLIVGLYIMRRCKIENAPNLLPIGVIAVVLAFGSALFHASATFMGELADLSSMYCFAAFAFCFNLWRVRKLSRTMLCFVFFGLVSGSILLLLWKHSAGVLVFSVLVFLVGSLELYLYRSRKEQIHYEPLRKLVFIFALSYLFWRLDFHGIWCPSIQHWINGHALWHLINASTFYFLYRFYRPFLCHGHFNHTSSDP